MAVAEVDQVLDILNDDDEKLKLPPEKDKEDEAQIDSKTKKYE